MKKKTFTAIGIMVILLVSLFGTAGAQTGTNPEETPTETPITEAGANFFVHPVVRLLSAYFDQDVEEEETPLDPNDPTVVQTPAPTGTEEAPVSGLGPIGEEIAAYHEQGMGFGVLVKIYAIAKASEEACLAETPAEPPVDPPTEEGTPIVETCVPVTAAELVEAFNGGSGMGALFKEYGKPALLGVGHVKQELKKLEAQSTEEPQADKKGPVKEKHPKKPKK